MVSMGEVIKLNFKCWLVLLHLPYDFRTLTENDFHVRAGRMFVSCNNFFSLAFGTGGQKQVNLSLLIQAVGTASTVPFEANSTTVKLLRSSAVALQLEGCEQDYNLFQSTCTLFLNWTQRPRRTVNWLRKRWVSEHAGVRTKNESRIERNMRANVQPTLARVLTLLYFLELGPYRATYMVNHWPTVAFQALNPT